MLHDAFVRLRKDPLRKKLFAQIHYRGPEVAT